MGATTRCSDVYNHVEAGTPPIVKESCTMGPDRRGVNPCRSLGWFSTVDWPSFVRVSVALWGRSINAFATSARSSGLSCIACSSVDGGCVAHAFAVPGAGTRRSSA